MSSQLQRIQLRTIEPSSSEYASIRESLDEWMKKMPRHFQAQVCCGGIASTRYAQEHESIDIDNKRLYYLYQLLPLLFEKSISVRNRHQYNTTRIKNVLEKVILTHLGSAEELNLLPVHQGEIILVLLALWYGYRPFYLYDGTLQPMCFNLTPTKLLLSLNLE